MYFDVISSRSIFVTVVSAMKITQTDETICASHDKTYGQFKQFDSKFRRKLWCWLDRTCSEV